MNIAIVGAGIGGLASAILFSQKGHSVTVYEQAKSPEPVGAGFLLQPPGQYVLKQLGVLDEVLKEAVPIIGLRSKTLDGRPLLDLYYKDLNGTTRHGLGIQRNNIFNALFKKASEQESIDFKWDNQVADLSLETNHTTIAVNQVHKQFDLCILSSGTNSPLANDYFQGRTKNVYSWGCLWATINLPSHFSPDVLHQRCKSSEKMMGILPTRKLTSGYEAALYWSMKGQTLTEFSPENFSELKVEVLQFWPEAKDAIEALSYSNFTAARYNDVWIPSPVNRRLVAIGDICHGTSPQLGQGATMALLDAFSLASYINEEELELSLKQWWASRKNQLTYIRYISRFLTPLYQSDIGAYGMFRDYLMAPLGRLPGLYTFQLKTLASEVLLDKDLFR